MLHLAPPACLNRPYSCKPGQKGGTLIAEGVLDRLNHRLRLANPDGYRPERCPGCLHSKLHAHSFRERRLRGDPDAAVETARRYRCALCLAVWLVLPVFMARCLHRSWRVVQSALVAHGVLDDGGQRSQRVSVPATTRRRWVGRLLADASMLVQALAGSAAQVVVAALGHLSAACSRAGLVEGLVAHGLLAAGHELSLLAGWLHRLVPGLRLV